MKRKIINKKVKYVKFNYSNYTVRVNGKLYSFDAWVLKRKRSKAEIRAMKILNPLIMISSEPIDPKVWKFVYPGSIIQLRNNHLLFIGNAVA